MEERKKYEFLVFLTIYVIFIGLMVPVALKGPQAFFNVLPKDRYGERVDTREGAPEEYLPRPSPYGTPIALIGAAGVIILLAVGGVWAYNRATRRDYRVTRQGRAECAGKVAERPHCHHYRPTPSTECAHFLGAGDEGMCLRTTAGRRAPAKRQT